MNVTLARMRRVYAAHARTSWKKWTAAVAALLIAGLPPAASAEPAAADAPYLVLSDVHFSPYGDPTLVPDLIRRPAAEWRAAFSARPHPPSGYGSDTNFALLESALDAMHAADPEAPVIVIAGDFLAHDFETTFAQLEPSQTREGYEQFVDKTIAFLAGEFDARFPRAQFVVALGNNDGYCGDYRSTPGSPFLAHFAKAWAPLVDRNGTAPSFELSFATGGYYRTALPTRAPVRVDVLNDVFWSTWYDNRCAGSDAHPGAAEHAWLANEMQAPLRSPSWIVAHIPPTIDAYDSARAHAPQTFLNAEDVDALLATLHPVAGGVRAFVAGHTHHASFALVGDGAAQSVPALVVPSVSPVQGNDPSFDVVTVGGDGTLLDVVPYEFLEGDRTMPVWTHGPSFDETYGVTALDAPSLAAAQARLATDAGLRASFASAYTAASLYGGITPDAWPWYWCANDHLRASAYAACVTAAQAPAR